VTKRFFSLVLLTLLIGGAAGADEIRLKSGKTMTGKITSETAQSYTLKLGANMFLSIDKDDVASVSKTRVETAPRKTVTLDTIRSTATVAAPAGSTATTKGTAPAQSPSTARPASPGAPVPKASAPRPAPGKGSAEAAADRETSIAEDLKIGVARISKTSRVRLYEVDGKDFESARRAILDEKSGRGFMDGGRRVAARADWEATWSGTPGPGGQQWKALVVVATVTVTRASWKGLARATPAEADRWAAFIKETTSHQAGHLEIIHDALMSFGESATNLKDANEKDLRADTAAAFKAIQAQAVKRRQGYERREGRPVQIPIKKKN